MTGGRERLDQVRKANEIYLKASTASIEADGKVDFLFASLGEAEVESHHAKEREEQAFATWNAAFNELSMEEQLVTAQEGIAMRKAAQKNS